MVPRGGVAQPSVINDLRVGGTPRSSHAIIRLSAVGVQRQSKGQEDPFLASPPGLGRTVAALTFPSWAFPQWHSRQRASANSR
jgi:hypothetical protein